MGCYLGLGISVFSFDPWLSLIPEMLEIHSSRAGLDAAGHFSGNHLQLSMADLGVGRSDLSNARGCPSDRSRWLMSLQKARILLINVLGRKVLSYLHKSSSGPCYQRTLEARQPSVSTTDSGFLAILSGIASLDHGSMISCVEIECPAHGPVGPCV